MDEKAKKKLLRVIPYALYAACTRGPTGEHHVFLLSWVTQASFEPPLVVCCVHRESRAHKELLDSHVLTLNLLGADQKPFATEILKHAPFTKEDVAGQRFREGANGCAHVTSTLGAIELKVLERVSRGDHSVFVCEVTDAHAFREGEPLTHENTGWHYGG